MSALKRRRNFRLLGLVLMLVLLVGGFAAACGDDRNAASPAGTALSGEIIVHAAASLNDAFKEAGAQFQALHPGVKVTFNFASSPALATQINQGQPGDVFASADNANMKLVTDKGGADAPAIFATNFPVIVVPTSGSHVQSFQDLSESGIKLVLAAPAVPIGNYARQAFTNASAANGGVSADFSDKVLANLESNETDVKAVLAKVQTGEADAGVVYTTDAAAVAKQIKAIPIPDRYNVIARYPIAVLKEGGHPDLANAFVAFITSTAGQVILQKYGFGKPDGAGPK
jgi:molybdate transport system substrate-binding protein